MAWHDAYETTYQKYRAPVINILKEKEALICSLHTKVSVFLMLLYIVADQEYIKYNTSIYFFYWLKGVLNGGTTERIMLAYGLEASQEAVTKYRVLGPIISSC